jgi:ATP-dependent Clp protease ATP-binding subunit ClpX
MPTFDEDRIKRIVALAEEKQKDNRKEWTPQAIFERLDEAIIGNKRYKQALAICLADFTGPHKIRNHLLVIGPSGTGKTYLLQQCLPDFGVPYHIIDASGLVPAGYKGTTLQESIGEFFRSQADATRGCVIVLDEFDKISENANGGDIHKSHSLQSELLTLVQGKQEGAVDTRNALWVLAGAFAYTDEMKQSPPALSKKDLLKYGFKNELLGRITKLTMTDIPSTEDVVRRVARDKTILAFLNDLSEMGYAADFADQAVLDIALAAQNPSFGMRVVPSLIADLKQDIVFNYPKGTVSITPEMVKRILGK